MANIKITELNEITKKANDDVLAIVDVSADETKKIAVGDLLDKNVELIAVTDTEPAECLYGDKYFNTIDNLIYTAIATDTWGEDGEEPISGILYIVYAEQASYSWDGSDLISVGGGKEDIVIDDEEPTDPDVKLWIDTGEVQNVGSELPLVYPVGSIYMSVNNTNPATLFGFGTWEQIKDTFLLSAGDTYTAGNTGGEATHTLTVNEIPSHRHPGLTVTEQPANIGNGNSGIGLNYSGSNGGSPLATAFAGGGQAHNNMPPYLVVYMWKRTA